MRTATWSTWTTTMKLANNLEVWHGWTIAKLSWWELLKLLCGREINAGSTIIRFEAAYAAFNLEARPVEARDEN